MKTKFDATIEVTPNDAEASACTPKGKKFLAEVLENKWSPEQVLANIPPNFRLGVRTSTRKKFVLIQPPSLH